jgi:hypothetical protein
VPFIRTNRPLPLTASVWLPPVPVVVEKIVVNGPVAAGAVWIWNAVANAASQLSRTWQTVAVPPRSTCSHCGSLNADDQRVVALPSTAAPAGVPAFSVEEAVAGWLSAALVVPRDGGVRRSGAEDPCAGRLRPDWAAVAAARPQCRRLVQDMIARTVLRARQDVPRRGLTRSG